MFFPNVIDHSRIRFANVAFVSGIALRLDAVRRPGAPALIRWLVHVPSDHPSLSLGQRARSMRAVAGQSRAVRRERGGPRRQSATEPPRSSSGRTAADQPCSAGLLRHPAPDLALPYGFSDDHCTSCNCNICCYSLKFLIQRCFIGMKKCFESCGERDGTSFDNRMKSSFAKNIQISFKPGIIWRPLENTDPGLV